MTQSEEKDLWLRALAQTVRELPEHIPVGWYSDHMPADRPWEGEWVATWIGHTPAWTIGPPWADEDEYLILSEPDLVMMALMAPAPECACGHCQITLGELVVPVRPETYMGYDIETTIRAIREGQHEAPADAHWEGAPAWSALAVQRTIEEWCLKFADRVVHAPWTPGDGPSPHQRAIDEAKSTMEAMIAGVEPSYMVVPGETEGGVGPTVMVSEQVMEMLAQSLLDADD